MLPCGPGLGIELNHGAVRKPAVPSGQVTPSGNYSDMLFLLVGVSRDTPAAVFGCAYRFALRSCNLRHR